MKIALLGAGGRLGAALAETWSAGAEIIGFNHAALDLAQPGEVERVLGPMEFDVVVNCAALTNVDYCETHEEEAMRTNAGAVRELGRLCRARECAASTSAPTTFSMANRPAPTRRAMCRAPSAFTARANCAANRRCSKRGTSTWSCAFPGCSARTGPALSMACSSAPWIPRWSKRLATNGPRPLTPWIWRRCSTLSCRKNARAASSTPAIRAPAPGANMASTPCNARHAPACRSRPPRSGMCPWRACWPSSRAARFTPSWARKNWRRSPAARRAPGRPRWRITLRTASPPRARKSDLRSAGCRTGLAHAPAPSPSI